MAIRTVAFLGLGLMGTLMVASLARAGADHTELLMYLKKPGRAKRRTSPRA